MKSNLPHHNIRRNLNSHDCENRILTAELQPPTGTASMESTVLYTFYAARLFLFFIASAYRMPRWNGPCRVHVVRHAWLTLLHFRNPVPPTFVNYLRNIWMLRIYCTSCLGNVFNIDGTSEATLDTSLLICDCNKIYRRGRKVSW